MTEQPEGRYPGYDVLRKRNGPSWNNPTRRAVDARLSIPHKPRFFNEAEWQILNAVCDRILPQDDAATRVNLAGMVDEKLLSDRTDGYRYPGMPRQGDAWRRGLAALEEAAAKHGGRKFRDLDPAAQDSMLRSMQEGRFEADALGDMPAKQFFSSRIIPDIVSAFYAHPTGWNEIGWGGPASPRGYVRMQYDMRDPWEPVEATPGHEREAERKNVHVR
ncbi:MAG: gluconate 2-dehydrogenase subunit 3 family protein [Acetobacteraceae bacterium]|nr:gluconate 2-dehydrogenase subunit 3 family protein [Acetobacteraceae bacterium]